MRPRVACRMLLKKINHDQIYSQSILGYHSSAALDVHAHIFLDAADIRQFL